ncbi:MAG: hypothetical protein AAFR97_15555, partial [Bacteroidota bacterium]
FPSIRARFLAKEARYLRSEEADALLKELRPSLLVATYPVSILEAKMLFSAKKRHIPTLLHLLSWDNITAKGRFPVITDYFIAWGDIMKEELQEYYQVSDQVIDTCGVAHFDQHIRIRDQERDHRAIEHLGLDPQLPYLFFAMSSPRFVPREIDIVEWLAQAVQKNQFSRELQLVVRPHPQNIQTHMAKSSWLKRLDRLSGNRVAVDYPRLHAESNIRWSMQQEDMDHLARLITGCAMCLNSGSTVSIDALMHHKPVIITSFDGDKRLPYWNSARRFIAYTHLDKFIKEGGGSPVFSYQDLVHTINRYLEDPHHDADRRRQALARECYKEDGQATKRICDSLESRWLEVCK